jgi:sigma-B regulation protein RsbU (phosphoserine phosphatase)
MEVWGGSQLTETAVEFGGLEARVFSRPYGDATHGGDVYYASSCATGRISRLLLADVAGHGVAVARTAGDLRDLMRRFVNRLDQGEFVRLLNRQFVALEKQGAFATAVVATFFAPTGRLTVCNAGHPRPFLYRAASGAWEFLEGGCGYLPLGLLDHPEYEPFDVTLRAGDRVVFYSDALIEAEIGGEPLGEEGVLEILQAVGVEGVLAEIERRAPGSLAADDVTLMTMTATGREHRVQWGRMLRTVLAYDGPLALPDFTLANVGGALVPALARKFGSARERGGLE